MASRNLGICLLSLMLPGTVARVHSSSPAPAQAETTKPGLEERQNALLGELVACESGSDPNPDRSGYVGRYQFSTATVSLSSASGTAAPSRLPRLGSSLRMTPKPARSLST